MRAHPQRIPKEVLLAALACLVAALLLAALPQAAQQPAAKSQDKQQQEKDKKAAPEEKKQGGGLFGGVRSVTSFKKTEDKELSASAGAKGVGEGKDIGKATVTAADREKVEKMASAKPSKSELQAFLKEGKLATERKGGGQ